MKKRLITRAALGLASLSLMATSAYAQSTPTSSAPGDLILGFRVDDNASPGGTEDLEVDFGNMSKILSMAPGTTISLNTSPTSNSGLASTNPNIMLNDLASTYGADWATRTDLTWGVIAGTNQVGASGVTGIPDDTLWLGIAEPTPGTVSSYSIESLGKNFEASGINAYSVMLSGHQASFSGNTSTTNSSNSIVVQDTTAGSWALAEDNTTNTEFAFVNGSYPGPVDVLVSNTGTAITSIDDFYQLNPQASSTGTGPAVLLGQFKLAPDGTFTYTAVPEPSSLGLMGVGFLSLIGMVVLRRRRSVVA